MVVYVLSTGSPDYIEWVKNQTEPQEMEEDSFQDIKPADLYKETFGQGPEEGAMLNTQVENTVVPQISSPNKQALQEATNV